MDSALRALAALVLAGGLVGACAAADAVGPGAPARFDAPGDDVTWHRLAPPAPRLPVWARTFAESLPATTAFHLDLDHVQRSRNPLGPTLAGEVRWVVADANRCAWSKECAESDLARAGGTPERLALLADVESLPEPDRTALSFARKLTLDAAAIADEEVAALIDAYGADDSVAIVHAVCYANFQDRLALALGLASEPGGTVPPLEGPPPADGGLPVPPRELPAGAAADGSSDDATDASAAVPWTERSFQDLRASLEEQRRRTARLPNPDPVRLARLPRPVRARMGRIAWGTVAMGYQPELTRAWFRTMETFEKEAGLDQVFASSVFWVVTRTSDCFY